MSDISWHISNLTQCCWCENILKEARMGWNWVKKYFWNNYFWDTFPVIRIGLCAEVTQNECHQSQQQPLQCKMKALLFYPIIVGVRTYLGYTDLRLWLWVELSRYYNVIMRKIRKWIFSLMNRNKFNISAVTNELLQLT